MRSTASLLKIGGIPHGPGSSSFPKNLIQLLLFLECVHASPKTIMRKRDQLLILNQAMERLLDQFLAIFHVAKNLTAKNEESPVDPIARFPNMFHAFHHAVLVSLDQME